MRAFDRTTWIAAVVAGLLAGAIAQPFFVQGLDMVDEGRWLLGARIVLQGDDLHATIAGGGSGLREHVLATWMRVVGDQATALASLRAVGFGLAAGAMVGLGAHVAGIGGAVALFAAALAALPLAPAAGLVWIMALVAVAFGERGRRTRGVLIGAALGAVFLLDPRTFLLGAALVCFLVTLDATWRREVKTIAAGLSTVVVLAVILASVSASPSAAFHATFVGPVVEGFGSVDPLRAVRTAWNGAWIDQPLLGLRATGETFEAAWPAHGTLRATALRLVVLAVPLILVAAWVARARGRSHAAFVVAQVVAVVALGALVLRGDVPSLRSTVPIVVLGLAVLAGRDRGRLATIAAAIACLPLAAEPVWFTARIDRPGLALVDGIRFDDGRAHRLESTRDVMTMRPGERTLIWPELPGIHWLLRTRPAAPHLDVPDDERADRETARALRANLPRTVFFGFSRAMLGHELMRRAPESWNVLRDNYRLRGRVLDGDENLRVLTRAGTGAPASEGMANQLPTVELTVANDVSPALREDFTLGQGFHSGPRDIEGFAFRARTSGTNVRLRMRVNVWEWENDRYSVLHASEIVETTIVRDGQVVFIEYPLDATADKDLAITMEAVDTPSSEVRLDWRSDDDAVELGDLYPEGDAILGLTPVDADLYFLLY